MPTSLSTVKTYLGKEANPMNKSFQNSTFEDLYFLGSTMLDGLLSRMPLVGG